jgi:Putative prokaryotic signal transducing protein
MADNRDGYALLMSVSTREEAGVVVAALRAGGIPAILGNEHHANAMTFGTVALGGMQVMIPAAQIAEARELLSERLQGDWTEDDDEPAPPKRRDRWKAWLLLAVFTAPLLFALPALIELVVRRWGNLFSQWFGG